jgi:hypothetical protein
MKARALIVSVVTSVVLLGCASTGPDGVPPIRTATPKDCPDAHGHCEVKVLSPNCPVFSKCTASVDFDPINLGPGKHDINIVWTLPAGYGFCPGVGDGVFLKGVDPDDQFDDMYATDMPDGTKPNGRKKCIELKHYHWKALNTKSKPKDPYEYRIRFHDHTGAKVYEIDPWVVNR